MTALVHQSMMIALLDNLTTIEHDNAIRVSNSGKSMCDQYSCTVLQDQIKPFLDLRLGQWVNTGSRFIQDDDRWVLQQHAC